MNHNYIIVLFLIFFLIHVEKTYGCHPSGQSYVSGGSQIQNATITSGSITVTTIINQKNEDGSELYTHALGHFTFNYNINGENKSVRLIGDPKFVNTHHCSHKGSNEVNPYSSTWNFKPKDTPPQGTSVAIKLATYWHCNSNVGFGIVLCNHEDLSFTIVT